MIKRTFYNLPAEKREKIIDVTRREFSKGNRKKITINSVIKNAGISRGSFYQYFDDKLDLVELITEDMFTRVVDFIRDELILNGGNIFAVPMRIFDLMINDSRQYDDVLALTDSTNQNNALVADYMRYRAHRPDFYAEFKDYIGRDILAANDDDDIKCVIFMMFDAVKAAIQNVRLNPKSTDKERAVLYRKMQILKNGAMAK
ncbi:MAG: TetR/AcrR family transcriptional regulator [Ruminococcus sp.]|nr:TetR/AcrR family transcriptional regulator [Ruminococcus sp.]